MQCGVVAACNVERHIKNVLLQLHRSGVEACLVVINGSTDESEGIAASIGPRLFDHFRTMKCSHRLGLDVPRSIGTYEALRLWPLVSQVVLVDGDFSGAFGPRLGDFVSDATDRDLDAAWPGRVGRQPPQRLDEYLWGTTLAKVRPECAWAKPSELPLVVNTRVFRELSPTLLYHPGRWLAACAQHRELRLAALPFDSRVLGNPARSAKHLKRMQDTLTGDALEGTRLLIGQKPHRTLHGQVFDGYHSERRIDLLAGFARRIQVLV